MDKRRSALQRVGGDLGSSWLTVLLLCLLMASLAGATLHEATQGAERTRALFYQAPWFRGLIGLLALNLLLGLFFSSSAGLAGTGGGVARLAGVAIRAGVLTVLLGGVITEQFGVTGTLTLAEGESLSRFKISNAALILLDRKGGGRSVVEFGSGPIDGPDLADRPEMATLELPSLGPARVLRYLPDMDWMREVTDDGGEQNPAVLLRLSSEARDQEVWVLPGEIVDLGSRQAGFKVVSDRASLKRLLPVLLAEPDDSRGVVRAEHGERTFEFPIEECSDRIVSIGESGFSFQVLQYMPHAVLGQDDTVVNQSNQPVNPAIEVVIVGPTGTEKHVLFAKDPKIDPDHPAGGEDSVLVSFLVPERPKPEMPIEVLSGPGSRLYVRFYWAGADVSGHFLEVGQPIETPWPGTRLTVLKQFERARTKMVAVATRSARVHRSPGLLLELEVPDGTQRVWLQRAQPQVVTRGEREFELSYGDAERDLGFELRLNRFRIVRYPGENKPESFESQVTLVDPAVGGSEDLTIDMSHPASFSGLGLHQLSYRIHGDQATSVLRVSRAPGQVLVHAGLLILLIGLSLFLSPWPTRSA